MNQNNISTNIFGHENKRLHPIYLSKEKFENCTALLLIGNEDKSQYVYIKDFLIDLRILKQNIKAKSIFVWAVYNALVLNKVVNFSIKVCLEIYVKEATKMPEKDSSAFFFYLGFLSRAFTIHRTAGEAGGIYLRSATSIRFTDT